jgi:hypothetical protein
VNGIAVLPLEKRSFAAVARGGRDPNRSPPHIFGGKIILGHCVSKESPVENDILKHTQTSSTGKAKSGHDAWHRQCG